MILSEICHIYHLCGLVLYQFRFHGSDVASLQSVFGLDCLPEELGGTLGPAAELSEVSSPFTGDYLSHLPFEILMNRFFFFFEDFN